MSEEIEIKLPNDQLFVLMLEAHAQDITLNQLVNNILIEAISREKVTLANEAIARQNEPVFPPPERELSTGGGI